MESGTDNVCSNGSTLEAEFSLLEEDFFGNRSEESDTDMSDTSASDSEGEDDGANSHAQPSVQPRDVDVEEVETVKKFIKNTCGCSKKNGAPCSGYFDQDMYEEARMSMVELEKDQLDLLILSLTNAHHFSGQLAGHRRENKKV